MVEMTVAARTPDGRRRSATVTSRFLLSLALTLGGLPPRPATAQDSPLPRVPKFDIAPSAIGLRGDVRPRQYVGVVGRKAAWLGWETGEAELWVPIKLASGFARLQDSHYGPIRGADVARTIEVGRKSPRSRRATFCGAVANPTFRPLGSA
jgi:hypothetical protein